MKAKWIPIKGNYELEDMSLVTRLITNGWGQKIPDVTIGYPGQGLHNRIIAYMAMPKDITKQPEQWQSEYRGDELPNKKTPCLVQLQDDVGKLRIIESYYLAKENKFLRVPDGWEVLGWMQYPKPYIFRNCKKYEEEI